MAVLKFIDRPRILFMGGGLVAHEVVEFLQDQKEDIIGLYLDTDENVSIDKIRQYNPDLIITCYWPYLLTSEMIAIPKYGCINFHPALLPKNRGWYPSVWEVMEGGHAGVTLHLIDEGADTGPVIAQMSFDVGETDTGGSIYNKSRFQMVLLFRSIWDILYSYGINTEEQDHSIATYHSKKETNALDRIDLDKDYNAGYLISLLKAKTFGDKSYAYYEKNGKKYFVKAEVVEG